MKSKANVAALSMCLSCALAVPSIHCALAQQPTPQERVAALEASIAASQAILKDRLPPDPALIEKTKQAGKVSVSPQPDQRSRLPFSDYLKPGDRLALDVDLGSNRPVEAKVLTYLDSKEELVSLDVKFGTLDNNGVHATTTELDAPSKSLAVDLQNSGYRRTGN
ncbi:MAG TPA: hypothetical protein PKM43_22315 [Verrucomicrobiota bacterium]|nr:hypothetical protein [Verrucomicrobiota bacterium]HRZ39214.1 hypothetical protein [Candidatus Paceibacterota bacterium]HRZ55077.1 hypothetical protein [Candidatus Paceibacterota bacterium]